MKPSLPRLERHMSGFWARYTVQCTVCKQKPDTRCSICSSRDRLDFLCSDSDSFGHSVFCAQYIFWHSVFWGQCILGTVYFGHSVFCAQCILGTVHFVHSIFFGTVYFGHSVFWAQCVKGTVCEGPVCEGRSVFWHSVFWAQCILGTVYFWNCACWA